MGGAAETHPNDLITATVVLFVLRKLSGSLRLQKWFGAIKCHFRSTMSLVEGYLNIAQSLERARVCAHVQR